MSAASVQAQAHRVVGVADGLGGRDGHLDPKSHLHEFVQCPARLGDELQSAGSTIEGGDGGDRGVRIPPAPWRRI